MELCSLPLVEELDLEGDAEPNGVEQLQWLGLLPELKVLRMVNFAQADLDVVSAMFQGRAVVLHLQAGVPPP